MAQNIFRGLGVALITPFNSDGSVDYDSLENLVKYQIESGADFFCILATTGETPCLTSDEKVGSNIASELGTMRVTQQIDALEIMGVNSAAYLILPKVLGFITIMPFLVIFSSATGILGAYATAYIGQVLTPEDLTAGLQHSFNPWFMWMSIIKSLFFAYIISSVSSYFGYSVEGGSVEVGKASTAAVVNSSVLILFSDVFLTQLLS